MIPQFTNIATVRVITPTYPQGTILRIPTEDVYWLFSFLDGRVEMYDPDLVQYDSSGQPYMTMWDTLTGRWVPILYGNSVEVA